MSEPQSRRPFGGSRPSISREIAMVDDGPTGGTREFLQELTRIPQVVELPQTGYQLRRDNIRVLFQEKNRGISYQWT